MPTPEQIAHEEETFELVKKLSAHAEEILTDAGRTSLLDLLLVLAGTTAMAIDFARTKAGTNSEALLANQNRSTRLIVQALARGEKPRFDA